MLWLCDPAVLELPWLCKEVVDDAKKAVVTGELEDAEVVPWLCDPVELVEAPLWLWFPTAPTLELE